ncbi:MAG: DNA/RNA non-specific endonuclease [FCB group bacterium]|jgi:endonuclease G
MAVKILYVLCGILIISYCYANKDPKNINPPHKCYTWVKSVHSTLGVPCDVDTTKDYIIVRTQYVLSYNYKRNVANWVAWELNSDWFGSVKRYKGNFITDTSLPTNFYHVKHSDYTNSGYDRGHMVMSEERTATVEDNMSTFILTNVLPQTPDLNRGVWLNFENYCNSLALDSNKELFIYAGGVFHTTTTIGNGVSVPDSCWKIVVVLERGQSLKDISINTPVYAVMMPNTVGVRKEKWAKYKTTVRRIEGSTGYDFLNAVSKTIQDVIENK